MKTGFFYSLVMFLRSLTSSLVFIAGFSIAAEIQTAVFPPQGSFVLPTSKGSTLLRQCSRATPQDVTEFWVPSKLQIEDLERKLEIYFAEQLKVGGPVPPRGSYDRQYIGFVKSNTRYIYGNFYPSNAARGSETSRAMLICDGGPSFWGIVFDTSISKFQPPQFNGVT